MSFTSYLEFPVEVSYDYFPGEPRTWNHPGCDEEVEITEVKIGDFSVLGRLSPETIEDLKEQALEAERENRRQAELDRAELIWLDRRDRMAA